MYNLSWPWRQSWGGDITKQHMIQHFVTCCGFHRHAGLPSQPMNSAELIWITLLWRYTCLFQYYLYFSVAENDLRVVCQEVVGIKSTYYQFGKELGIPPGELDSIRKQFHHDHDQAIDEVLLLWLRQRYDVERHGRPTWRRLVEAVDSSNGGSNPALAIDITNRHTVSGINYFSPLSLSLSLSLFHTHTHTHIHIHTHINSNFYNHTWYNLGAMDIAVNNFMHILCT